MNQSERQKVFAKTNGHCAYCGCELTLKTMQVDHIVSKYWHNGPDELSNYHPSCRQCNFYKSSMTLENFRKQLGLIVGRLNEREFIYRLAKKYGLIQETPHEIKFYFERMMEE